MSYLIEQHLTGLRAEGRSEDTIAARRRCLTRLHADLPHGLAAGCREQLTAWLAGPQEDGRRWKPATRRIYAQHVFEFYRWLVACGYLDEDPTAGMRLPRPPQRIPRPATDQQLAVALTAPEPLRTAVILANWAGLRRTEIINCRREHITEQLILIPVAKGGDPQTAPCHPVVWEHVRDRPEGPLIVDEDGTPYTRERLSLTALRWFRRAGMPELGLHRFRHRYGTAIQEAQGDLRLTQECMRHKSIASTVGYTLVTGQRRRDAVLRLPGLEHRPDAARPVPPTD